MPIKIQSEHESLEDAIEKLERATKAKDYPMRILIQTRESEFSRLLDLESEVQIIKSLELQTAERFKHLRLEHNIATARV